MSRNINYKYDFKTFNISLLLMRLARQGISTKAVAEISGVGLSSVYTWINGEIRPRCRKSIDDLIFYSVNALPKNELEECGISVVTDVQRSKISACFDGIIDEITRQSFGGSKMRITDLINTACADLGIPDYQYGVDVASGQQYRKGQGGAV